ncbi:NAD(P)-dependent dehydrogenase (short-subunit alcohol dehydrogenase family) [Actinoplanes octamycinicus]|uniref:NAD(P)-dependent dehydrogenase (Short-subunit alcohol dehydrogenase family) n=1 Tax=Actinoplanes octamycinicus TaxID=135948 RepID=A0A7W7H3F8_9ACTN|nr:SDR family oxidoreductase [Actinoplanes octamycinicus]MBB4743259.1 NAD(P)-dependent dehydrogenase (short-subunit alcohol dehydrogenase family) [Actinoplanes octamycinicus]GIE63846.1 short-chain dehydrogenase [Actinoplanes octamycinicus]
MAAHLDGRIALVTGASRGIGRAIAERLGRDGAFVVVHYARDDAAAREVVATIAGAGGQAAAVRAELGTPGDIGTLFAGLERALRDAGREVALDILVNNAGIGLPATIEQVDEAGFDRVFAVNVKAPFFLTQRALPLLRDGGRIINVSSGVTRVAFPEGIAYASTKGALDAFGHSLAKHVGPRGITVNAVAPGVIDTDVNAGWLRDNPGAQATVAEWSALGRVGQPADVADAVAFLASDDARWVTAGRIDATGGARI